MSTAASPDGRQPVVIVGGGYAGTILAAELARRGVAALVVEGGGRAGRGVAYSTTDPAHLLNVPAGKMSAFADDPDHFMRASGLGAGAFAERRAYGDYLRSILDQSGVRVVGAAAVAAAPGPTGWQVELDKGATLAASALVIATGNEAPGGLAQLAGLGEHYVANPWGAEARAAIAAAAASGDDQFIVGTGLTMVDTVLSLDEAGFAGRIVALSRRGQMPRVHADFDPAPADAGEVPQGSLRDLWRWLRQRSAAVGWRAAIDSLRPHSHALWQSLPEADQRRFLRHARAHWDVRRHRIAPAVGDRIARLIADGRLEIVAGRIEAASDEGPAIAVTYRRRGAQSATRGRFGHVFNCTGPLGQLSRTRDPLLRSLLDSGVAQPDALDIGLALERGARVRGATRLWALSALTKGTYWEITAVPDIRGQAAAVAADICEELANEPAA